MSTTITNSYTESYAYSASTTKSKNNCNSFDPNKKYTSGDAFANDLFKLEDNYRVQYRAMTKDSEADTVDKLKEEISKLFPEYTMVSSDPDNVSNGKNLLYIDDTNLQKMLDDPSYKADVYALMKRELAGNDGYHVFGSAWKITGFVFSLSERNSKEGGIPYAGMSTSVRLDDAMTFSGSGRKGSSILSSIKVTISSKTEAQKDGKKVTNKKETDIKEADKKDENASSNEEQLQTIWEKERQSHKEYIEFLEDAAQEKSDKAEQYQQEFLTQKYEKNILYANA